jgi:dephospho-CoA kinase
VPSTTAFFRVALTGGIASGKTAVANAFAALGVPIIDADQVARDVVEPGTPALAQIVNVFGADVLDSTGRMDRRRMRDRVFADPEQRKKLEAITHPAVRAEFVQQSLKAGGRYQIHAIPLFVEGGAKGDYDRILVVDCSEPLQLQRLMQRDQIDAIQARQILSAQATREQRLAVAQDVIVNNDSLTALHTQVNRLHKQYLESAAEKTAR